jgi:hypothetical protein
MIIFTYVKEQVKQGYNKNMKMSAPRFKDEALVAQASPRALVRGRFVQ